MSITFAFVVEIIIGGTFCSFWIVLLVNYFLGKELNEFFTLIKLLSDSGWFAWFIAIITIYVLGWISQYIGDLFFDRMQRIVGYKPFNSVTQFHKARTNVFQNGSKTIIEDIQLDRQILRISKLVSFNSLFISLSSLIYFKDSSQFSIIVCVGFMFLCIFSFFHWKKRFSDTMKKFHAANKLLLKEKASFKSKQKSLT